jgi:uncharacterized protein YecE (DUF72 family)
MTGRVYIGTSGWNYDPVVETGKSRQARRRP